MSAPDSTFHAMYAKYAGDVYRFTYWLAGNEADAKDLTAETFVRAFTGRDEPRAETVKAYLFTIARNLHRKQWHRANRQGPMPADTADSAVSPDVAAATRDDLQRARAAIRALPEPDRTAFLLRVESGLAYEEIARLTGLSVAAAKVKVFRARARLTAQFQSHP